MKTAPGRAHKDTTARTQAAGREARNSLPRRDFAALTLPEPDPVGILEGQHATRLADLIPVRVGRMLETPFSFYRGAAAIMAEAMWTKRKPIMRRWSKPSIPGGCPLNAACSA